MAIKTRKPTCKPDWPVLLIAGAEKSGKSYACALASASEKVGRTLWVSVGETAPDQYGAIPGADFEIVEHNNTVRGVLDVLVEIASLPAEEKPTLLVIDSMTRLWDMVTDDLQRVANTRAQKKYGKGSEGQITMDLWNRGKGMWRHIVQAINAHHGPVLLTARLEPVTVLDDQGKPTNLKADKIKTEKTLPYDVDGVIQMPTRGKVIIDGLRSVHVKLDGPTEFKDFTVDGLWDALKLGDTAPRQVSEPVITDRPEMGDEEATEGA